MINRGLILMFHEVNDATWFENTIEFIKSKYNLVDLGYFESNAGQKKVKRPCHITFDDGHISFYKIAYPILIKHQVPTTLFVSPEIIKSKSNYWFKEIEYYEKHILTQLQAAELGIDESVIKDVHSICTMKCLTYDSIQKVIQQYQLTTQTEARPPQNMSAEEIIEVDKSDFVTIGAHTITHPILGNETGERSCTEITQSIDGLRELLGRDIKYFAYPNGIPGIDFTEREYKYLADSQIALAVSTESDFVHTSSHRYSLPRISISHGSVSYIRVKLFLGKWFDYIQSLLHSDEYTVRKKIYTLAKPIIGRSS